MKKILLVLLYIAIPVMVSLVALLVVRQIITAPANSSDTALRIFEVPENAGFKQIARDLQQQGFIKYPWALSAIAKIRGKDVSIMAGEYELAPAMSPEEILEKMASGKMLLRRVTVKEGASIWEIGPLLESAGITSRADFEAAVTDPRLLRELEIEATSFEGYLFPETYQFPRNTKARKVISTMVEQLNSVLTPEWNQRMQIMRFTRHQLLTLASIVEKESGNAAEQPKISAVFTNRLKRSMRLQADPTVIYGIPNFQGNLTKEDLTTPTPYNTYVIEGLPPGPIANPGRTAIEAALFPAQTNDLYFVANGQGGHIFSENLSDHNNAVNEFQRGGGKQQKPPSQ